MSRPTLDIAPGDAEIMRLFMRRELNRALFDTYRREASKCRKTEGWIEKENRESYVRKLELEAGEFNEAAYCVGQDLLKVPAGSLFTILLKLCIVGGDSCTEMFGTTENVPISAVFDDFARLASAAR